MEHFFQFQPTPRHRNHPCTNFGHSFLTRSYLISKEPQSICDSCHTTLTIKHIVEEHTQYFATRTDLNMSPNIAETLDEGQTTKILTFLSTTNIMKKL